MIPERLRPVLDEARPLAERFADAGHRLYLVGGIVRDLLVGREFPPGVHDIDLTTDALPEQTKKIVADWADAVWTQGERFGTIGCRRGVWDFEITTHRAEAYTPDSRKPEVVFADAVEADLSRRDFTVNAMALSLPDPELVDPFGGAADLAAGRLRTPLSPEESFGDDPLRMLRAARFIAGYGLEPDPELTVAVEHMRSRLEIVSAERISDELDKLLVVEDPSAGLWFLVETELIDEFLPEVTAMRLEQDPIHQHKDVLSHTFAVVAKTRPERIVRLAALFHDVGKPKTRAIGPQGVSFHHHEVVGARMTRDRMRALKYSNEDVDTVSRLVYLHLRFHTYRMGWTDSAVRRFVRDAGPLLSELIELTRCDCTTRNERKARTLARRMDELEERIAELQEREELAAIRPDLDGNEVMTHLDLGPGPDVGAALDFLLELRLDQGPLPKEEAYRLLDEWWAERGSQVTGSCDGVHVTGFYGEDQADIHHREFGDLARTAADLVIDELRRAGLASGTVVDLGCGSGILARAVSEAGYRVIGVDLSPDMIELARAEAPLAEITTGSVHDAAIPPAVAVTAVGEVLNYATDARAGLEALATLAQRIAAALAPGGIFVFDVATPGRHGPSGRRTVFHDREDWSLAMEADEHDHTLDRRIVVFRRTPPSSGTGADLYRRTDEHHVLRLYDPDDVEQVLGAAGFTVERRAGYGVERHPLDPLVGLGRLRRPSASSRALIPSVALSALWVFSGEVLICRLELVAAPAGSYSEPGPGTTH